LYRGALCWIFLDLVRKAFGSIWFVSKKTYDTMSSYLAGYVATHRCLVTFDGTNYAVFAFFICIHMSPIRLWRVLSCEASYQLRSVAPLSPTLRMPPMIATNVA
jgi:hypothetical protein